MIASALAIGLRFDFEGLICLGGIVAVVVLATSTRQTARRCPRCREINREAAIYCAQCGARLPGR